MHGFLHRHGLEKEVRVNVEANHAALAGRSFEHEIATAIDLGLFGSLDMNRGDPQNGWDTDQFPNDLREITLALYLILQSGGFTTGGINFDAKVRRQSIDAEDLFHGHVGAIDLCARSLLAAAAMLEDGALERLRSDRYASWQGNLGRQIMEGRIDLVALGERVVEDDAQPAPRAGRQEYLENYVTRMLR